MRDHILLFVNGTEHQVSGTDAFLTLSDFLRLRLGKCGTKIVCSEGDCGSCSVLSGRLPQSSSQNSANQFEYRVIDSCIRFVFQLDGCHIVTVEGIGDSKNDQLHPVQQSMIDCHGSQCGFCTPGFVVAMAGLLENENSPTEDEWRRGLSGNLCRCTGYAPIVAAGLAASKVGCEKLAARFDETAMAESITSKSSDSIKLDSADGQSVFSPTCLADATEFLAAHPDAKIVAGATDVGVQFNKGRCEATRWLNLNRIAELSRVSIEENEIVAGANTTWSEIETVCEGRFDSFKKIISIFGSPQIRNVGTIGGNIINASPIADSLPFLFVCDAILELTGSDGTRQVNINDFYQDYKQFDLQPGELLTKIRIPLLPPNRKLELYKVSRRLDMDISTFTGAIWMDFDGNQIAEAGIALGAVGPVVLRLRKTEEFFRGQTFSESTMQQAGDIAVSEITPISDVRGSKDFRLQLTRNILLKFFHQSQQEALA
ncbi:xanthine dehydrogenase small subunit [Mariniblastus fucicola]|uniref:Aldehyde oxidoreductase n=1 Tax=Mariniblastus fucicola TaxID=980251 RepID=A0A5B9P3J6_9BACT|nr:FAD binding domain-containing protein [Mariniblastus fucicola]QEG20764.1 Aldehyde oxidoreductase [Mariniblastus fucicola]